MTKLNVATVPVTDPIITTGITVSGFGATPTVASVYSRIGQNAHIRSVVKVTAASGYGTQTFTLPAELTPDFTKIPVQEATFGTTNAWVGEASIVDVTTGVLFKGRVLLNTPRQITIYGPNGQGSWNGTVPVTMSANMSITIDIIIPIVGWSSNVTTGDRALEEYVFNTSGITAAGATDTSAYGYGANGALIPAINSTTTTGESKTFFDVQFATPAQATDKVVLELYDGNGWTAASERLPPLTLNLASYGVIITAVSSTKYRVGFGNAGYNAASAATYAAVGGAWSVLNSAGWRWRVRKVSSGAQVGYPVSTANIVGRVDGNAPASGYIGEEIESTKTTNTVGSTTLGTFTDTGVSIALTPGIWEVEATTAVSMNGIATATNNTGVIAQSQITDASNNVQRSVVGGFGNANSYFVWANHFIKVRIIVTSNTTYKSRFAAIVNTGSPTITVCTAQGAPGYPLVIRAIRIA